MAASLGVDLTMHRRIPANAVITHRKSLDEGATFIGFEDG